MATINMHDAKTQLSDLVARAEAGEEIIIARRNKPAVRLVRVRTQGEMLPPVERVGFSEDKQAGYDAGGLREAVEQGREYTIMKDGKPVAKVVPIEPEKFMRKPGALKDIIALPESAFDPLPDDEIAAWEGKYSNDGQ